MSTTQPSFRLLAGIPEEDRTDLLRLAVERLYKEGDIILHEGDTHDGLYLIQDGSIEVVRKGEEPGGSEGQGIEQSLTRMGTGNFFGDLSVFDDGPATASVRANKDSKLLLIPKGRLEEYLRERPTAAVRFYRNLLSELARRLRKLDQKLVERIVWVHDSGQSAKGGA